MANNRTAIDPWYGLPFSRPPSAIREFGGGLVELFGQLRGRSYLRRTYAHGVALTVESMAGLSSVPDRLAARTAAIFALAQNGEWQFDCEALGRFPQLLELSLGAFVRPANLHALTALRTLKRLSIEERFEGALDLGMLVELCVPGGVDIAVPSQVDARLEALSVDGNARAIELREVAPNLRVLSLSRTRQRDIEALLGERTSIEVLTLINPGQLETLGILQRCPRVSHLKLENCRDLRTLDGLSHCEGLREIEIRDCRKLSDVTALTGRRDLAGLYVVNCPGVSRSELARLEVASSYLH